MTFGPTVYLSQTDTLVTINENREVLIAYPQYTPTTNLIENMLTFQLKSQDDMSAQTVASVS